MLRVERIGHDAHLVGGEKKPRGGRVDCEQRLQLGIQAGDPGAQPRPVGFEFQPLLLEFEAIGGLLESLFDELVVGLDQPVEFENRRGEDIGFEFEFEELVVEGQGRPRRAVAGFLGDVPTGHRTHAVDGRTRAVAG